MKALTQKSNEEGQELVTTAMKDIKKAQMTSVIWTTPLGLPIVQPYRKITRKQIKTQMQTVFIADANQTAEGS